MIKGPVQASPTGRSAREKPKEEEKEAQGRRRVREPCEILRLDVPPVRDLGAVQWVRKEDGGREPRLPRFPLETCSEGWGIGGALDLPPRRGGWARWAYTWAGRTVRVCV